MNKNESISPEDSKKEQIVSQIGGILNEVSIMGANSSEIPDLMKLMDDVKNGRIDPEVGLKQAQEIAGQKQDYH